MAWLTVLFLLFGSSYISLVLSNAIQYPRSKFKAAVYEHKVILPEVRDKPVSRQAALSLMYKNLDVYATQIEAARKQNVDILVFPEDGLYGMVLKNRTYLAPYLEYIPDPLQETWNPCANPDRHANTNIQHRLSCLARNSALYLVVNMGDKQPCSNKTDSLCPSDGQYQYNTDVVYDPTGTLIARYHKENLFQEPQFDKPKRVNFVYFDTNFGRFGVFTCFDILFRDPPITLVERYGIGNVVFPTAWMDALPLLAALQFHSSFAVKMGVNLLAANIHLPFARFHGSGIYTPDTGAVYYYENSILSEGRLLISEIDVVTKSAFHNKELPSNFDTDTPINTNTTSPTNKIVPPTKKSTSPINKATTPRYKDAPPINNNGPPRDKEAPPTDKENLPYSDLALPSISISAVSKTIHFKSVVFHDLYNFVLVQGRCGFYSVCHNTLCCHLHFEKDDNDYNNDVYAFGAFDGMHTYDGRYYLQICTLLRCANSNRESCGSHVKQAKTRFQYIRINGTFGTPYVFPAILLTDDGQLKLAPNRWTFRDLVLQTTKPMDFPLLSANLFGRIYNRDVTDDTTSSGSSYRDCSYLLMLVFVCAFINAVLK